MRRAAATSRHSGEFTPFERRRARAAARARREPSARAAAAAPAAAAGAAAAARGCCASQRTQLQLGLSIARLLAAVCWRAGCWRLHDGPGVFV
jgi:hypothetical protein